MKPRLMLLALTFAATLVAEGQSDVRQLQDLYHNAWQAMIAKDSAALRQVHAPSFVLVHITGKPQQLASFIDEIRNNTLNYFSERTDGLVEVRLTGPGVAEVEARSEVEAGVYGGPRRTWHLRMRYNAEKRDDRWQFTHCRVSQY